MSAHPTFGEEYIHLSLQEIIGYIMLKKRKRERALLHTKSIPRVRVTNLYNPELAQDLFIF